MPTSNLSQAITESLAELLSVCVQTIQDELAANTPLNEIYYPRSRLAKPLERLQSRTNSESIIDISYNFTRILKQMERVSASLPGKVHYFAEKFRDALSKQFNGVTLQLPLLEETSPPATELTFLPKAGETLEQWKQRHPGYNFTMLLHRANIRAEIFWHLTHKEYKKPSEVQLSLSKQAIPNPLFLVSLSAHKPAAEPLSAADWQKINNEPSLAPCIADYKKQAEGYSFIIRDCLNPLNNVYLIAYPSPTASNEINIIFQGTINSRPCPAQEKLDTVYRFKLLYALLDLVPEKNLKRIHFNLGEATVFSSFGFEQTDEGFYYKSRNTPEQKIHNSHNCCTTIAFFPHQSFRAPKYSTAPKEPIGPKREYGLTHSQG